MFRAIVLMFAWGKYCGRCMEVEKISGARKARIVSDNFHPITFDFDNAHWLCLS
jgi:hypothetical protein